MIVEAVDLEPGDVINCLGPAAEYPKWGTVTDKTVGPHPDRKYFKDQDCVWLTFDEDPAFYVMPTTRFVTLRRSRR